MLVEKYTVESDVSYEIIKDAIINLLKNYHYTSNDLSAMKKEWGKGIPFEGGMSTPEAFLQIIMNEKL